MLRFFSGFDFRQADGVEINPKLAAIADQNIKKLNLSSRVFMTDARDFTDWEYYTWFYFYNPFPAEVMDVCLREMIESVRNKPRTLHVLYSNPECHRTLLANGFKEMPVKYSAFDRLWLKYLSGLKRYRYDPCK